MLDKKSRKDSVGRLEATLAGAFAGSPTPLKDIPKRNGEPRSQAKHAAHPSKLERGAGQRRKDGKAD